MQKTRVGRTRKTIRREKPKEPRPFATLTDAERYQILSRYRLGETVIAIADSLSVPENDTKAFITNELNGLNTVRETNKLVLEQQGMLTAPSPSPTKLLTEDFLSLVDDRAEAYAYYLGVSGSNEFALKESGLDCGIKKTLPVKTKSYAYRLRGEYLRRIPSISKYIEQVRDEKLRDMDISKPMIQSELVDQIGELKELAYEDQRYRGHLLNAVKMLGQTIGAFQDNIKVEEVSAKSGLELLMEKAQKEAEGEAGDTYELGGVTDAD